MNYAKVHNDYEIVFSDLKMPILAKTPKTKSVRISTQNYLNFKSDLVGSRKGSPASYINDMSNIRVAERKKIDIDRSDLFILSHLSRDMIISTMW